MQQPFSAEIWSCCSLLTVETVTQTLSSSIFILHCLFCRLSNIHTTASPQDYKTQPQKLSSQPISLSTSSPPSTPPKIFSLNLTVYPCLQYPTNVSDTARPKSCTKSSPCALATPVLYPLLCQDATRPWVQAQNHLA